jgi:hypothetical protein
LLKTCEIFIGFYIKGIPGISGKLNFGFFGIEIAASVVRNIADKLIACSNAILSTFLGSIIHDSIISSNLSFAALYQ